MLRLKELRQQHGYTQEKLAEKIGVARSTIAMYETEGSEPDLQTLSKLAEVFKVSIDCLMGKDEQKLNENLQQENTIKIIGRGGTVKEFSLSEEKLNAIRTLLESDSNNDGLY